MNGPGERLYLEDMPELHIQGESDDSVKRRHVRRYLEAIRLAGRAGGIWLDMACGSGYGADLIANRARVYIGIDRSPDAISYAMKKHGGPGRLFLQSDAPDAWHLLRAWGIKPDVILSVETLEHLDRHAQSQFIQDAGRALNDGGTFVLCCPIGTGPNPANRFHLYEPREAELLELLQRYFSQVESWTEAYQSTAGEQAIQIFAECRDLLAREDRWPV